MAEDTNALEMSDEDFLKMPDSYIQSNEGEDTDVEESNDTVDEEDNEIVSEDEDPITDDDEAEEEGDEITDDDDSEEDTADDVNDSTDEGEEAEETPSSDNDALIAELYKPFKANGREMQVDNIDDARTLMQMGANYNKKMAAIKPNLKMIKMLENNGLLEEGKLNYLIDLHNKNPEAITQLIKDSKIDPLEIDVEADTAYKPNTYSVDDGELAFDAAIESHKDKPGFNEIANVILNEWDDDSKSVIKGNPDLMGVLANHKASGVYEQVMDQVEHQRALGRLNSISDIQAYQQVGDLMYPKDDSTTEQPSKATTKAPTKAKRATVDPKLRARRNAASSPRAAPNKKQSKKVLSDDEMANMSDEDFMKLDGLENFI